MPATVTYDALLGLVERALVAHGYSALAAAPIARTITQCERDGTRSHGLLRLPGYIEAVRSGWADGTVLPRVTARSPSMLVIDAGNGFTHLALAQSECELAGMAMATGIAVLLIGNAHHGAALWPDIEGLAREGFVAMTCVNSRARLTGWGGSKAVFGTNASAFACPRAGGDPVVWDQSTSVMSQGDVLLAAREGRAIPEGVGVDAKGRPTTDPKAVLDGGALLPFGGHKGASIAFAVEILAAALTGAPFGFESPAKGILPSKCGQFLLVIDPRRAGAEVGSRVEGLVAAVRGTGSPHTPGSRRYERRRKSQAEGIPLGEDALANLEKLAAGPAATTT
ncbi:MAG TPA: Ldh family oxidoreductase [Usitatibacteraceae bacterium]|nr:Ldh family oxidoreductase [Usitatibacteraceae bacterium]